MTALQLIVVHVRPEFDPGFLFLSTAIATGMILGLALAIKG